MLDWEEHKRKPVIIFAIDEAEGIPVSHQHDWFKSWCNDRGIAFKPVNGCYKGKFEVAYVMFADMEERLWKTWCKRQESILFLTGKVPGDYRQARLHYADGKEEAIGQWREIGALDALADCEAGKGFTHDPRTGQYWRVA